MPSIGRDLVQGVGGLPDHAGVGIPAISRRTSPTVVSISSGCIFNRLITVIMERGIVRGGHLRAFSSAVLRLKPAGVSRLLDNRELSSVGYLTSDLLMSASPSRCHKQFVGAVSFNRGTSSRNMFLNL